MPTSNEEFLLTPSEDLEIPDEEILAPTFVYQQDIEEIERVEAKRATPTEFDPRYREPFMGLIYLGKLTKTEILYGHSFYLETPSQSVVLEGGLLHKQYLNSLSSELAWAAIRVGTYLLKVDDKPLPEPIGPADSGLNGRVTWILSNLKGQVIQDLYEKCLLLDVQVNDTLRELERLGEF